MKTDNTAIWACVDVADDYKMGEVALYHDQEGDGILSSLPIKDYEICTTPHVLTKVGRVPLVDLLDDNGRLILDLPNGQIIDIDSSSSSLRLDLRDGVYVHNDKKPHCSLGGMSVDKSVMQTPTVYKDGIYVTRDTRDGYLSFDQCYNNYTNEGYSLGDHYCFYNVFDNSVDVYSNGVVDALSSLDGYIVYEVKYGKLL